MFNIICEQHESENDKKGKTKCKVNIYMNECDYRMKENIKKEQNIKLEQVIN